MIKDEVSRYISENGNSHILIHSDILFGFKIKFEGQQKFLEEHYQELEQVCQPLDLVMPSFNYNFCQGTPYNMKTSESQVGALSEYFRTSKADWRTSTPVFHFSGVGDNPLPDHYGKIDPFDENSMFGFLHQKKGLMMHYGSGFNTSTLIHYVERISQKLIYRYDKIFSGQVIDLKNISHKSDLIFHVRPMGYNLGYDWNKIENDLIHNNVIAKYKEKRTQIYLGRLDRIVDSWLSRLEMDPFYFLDVKTREWVEKRYMQLNRKFELNDFE